MKKDKYTLLMTEREPIVYVEHAKVVLKDDMLTVLYSDGSKEIIPAATTMLLMMGAGTSITQSASIFCAKNNLFLCFARGGSYIHSIWQGKWSAPEKIVKQSLLHSDTQERLRIAKQIIKLKLKKHNVDKEHIDKVKEAKNIESLMSIEGNCARYTYSKLSDQYCDEKFKRDKDSREG